MKLSLGVAFVLLTSVSCGGSVEEREPTPEEKCRKEEREVCDGECKPDVVAYELCMWSYGLGPWSDGGAK